VKFKQALNKARISEEGTVPSSNILCRPKTTNLKEPKKPKTLLQRYGAFSEPARDFLKFFKKILKKLK